MNKDLKMNNKCYNEFFRESGEGGIFDEIAFILTLMLILFPVIIILISN